ncbi:hypothetical protein ACQKLP_17780 [Chitinophaga sp. NPDC101104]|uniref:hypothetical protein n=1 Tax=Chitinophaga sp. NPDC101104 TaxID=3390561 RepID=UPI003D05C72B
MENYLNYYLKADNLLKLVIKSRDQQVIRKNLPKFYSDDSTITILEVNGLLEVIKDGEERILVATVAGKHHVTNGGFTAILGIETVPPVAISFKQHLENNTNLLTIFGILNAVILFSSQEIEVKDDKLKFIENGMQFISISMYLLSLMVLFEIIRGTIDYASERWEFQFFYFLLCTTTIGVGMLFFQQYWPVLGGFLFFLAFIGGAIGLSFLQFRLLQYMPDRFFPRRKQQRERVIFIFLFIGLFVMYFVVRALKKFAF